jgi:hypothetical protein
MVSSTFLTVLHKDHRRSLLDDLRVEKYRPDTLDDVVSHKDITGTSEFYSLGVKKCYTDDGSPCTSRKLYQKRKTSASAILWSSRFVIPQPTSRQSLLTDQDPLPASQEPERHPLSSLSLN